MFAYFRIHSCNKPNMESVMLIIKSICNSDSHDLTERRNILSNTGTLLQEANRLLQLGRHLESIYYYDRVLDKDQNNLNALIGKGFALQNLGRYNESIEYYDRSLSIDSRNTYALTFKGELLDQMGNYIEAIQNYDKFNNTTK